MFFSAIASYTSDSVFTVIAEVVVRIQVQYSIEGQSCCSIMIAQRENLSSKNYVILISICIITVVHSSWHVTKSSSCHSVFLFSVSDFKAFPNHHPMGVASIC